MTPAARSAAACQALAVFQGSAATTAASHYADALAIQPWHILAFDPCVTTPEPAALSGHTPDGLSRALLRAIFGAVAFAPIADDAVPMGAGVEVRELDWSAFERLVAAQ